MSEPHQPTTSEAVTHSVRVEVESQYTAKHSNPMLEQWRFFYTVKITNEGDDKVQLLSRHWIITDAAGEVEEVKGGGVVGEFPILGPGESFQYTSWAELKTSSGSMRGTYQMVGGDGEHFDVEIASFALHAPYTVH